MAADVFISVIFIVAMIVLHILRMRELTEKIDLQDDVLIGAASILGTRQVQQDYFGVKKTKDAALVLLADGTGENGEYAAKMSVDTFRDLFDNESAIVQPQYFFKRAANATNKRIVNTLEERQGTSSVVAAIFYKSQLFYTLVGNCKIAIFREGDLIPVSEGQTIDVLARHAYTEGKISKQETLALLNEHRRYNVLGQDSFQDIEIFDTPLSLYRDDIVVMMSEGVFNALRWVDLEAALSKEDSVQNLAKNIIKMVERSPKVDKENATVLLISRKK